MTIHDVAQSVFSFLCHQEAARAWAPGGVAAELCARCAGVWAGAAVASACAMLPRPKPTSRVLWAHGLAMLQVMVFGFGLVSHGPAVRTLSGQLFAIGAAYYLQLCPSARWARSGGHSLGRALPYWLAAAGSVALLQILVRLPWPGAATALDMLSLIGLACFAGLSAATLVALLLERIRGPAKRESA